MKNFSKFLLAFSAAALFAAGCVNEDPAYRSEPSTPDQGDLTGFVTFTDTQMRVVSEVLPDDTGGETTRPTAAAVTRTQPDVAGYTVELFDAQGSSVYEGTFGELQQLTEPLALPVGNYTLEARSQQTLPDTGWDTPVYVGTKEFSILKDKTTEIDQLTCTMANIKVSLVVSVDLAAKLSDDTRATVSLGEKSEIFSLTESRAAYFMPDAQTNTLRFRLAGKFSATDSEVEFSKNISGVRAGQWRKITLVISYADKGNAKFDIKVDNFTLDEEVTVDGTSGLGEWEPVYNEPTLSQPEMTWTNNDFAQPFQLTAAMFDAEGNCSEPFELKLNAPNGVETFFVEITSTDSGFMEALGLVGINGRFDLCALSPAEQLYAVLKGFGFPVGSDIKDAKTKTFYIGGPLPSLLYNFEGSHSFSFEVTDTEGLTESQTLTILVDKANEGPVITWNGYDIEQVQELSEGMAIELTIAAGPGIKALEVTIDSEELTPLLGSLDPPLPAHFDLCTISGETAELLKGFGFPVGAEVIDQTEIPFSITTFVPILMMIQGQHNFIVKVTDNNGGVTEQTLQLLAK